MRQATLLLGSVLIALALVAPHAEVEARDVSGKLIRCSCVCVSSHSTMCTRRLCFRADNAGFSLGLS